MCHALLRSHPKAGLGLLTGRQADWLWLGPQLLPTCLLRVLTAGGWLPRWTKRGGAAGLPPTVSHQGEALCRRFPHVTLHVQPQPRCSVRGACTGHGQHDDGSLMPPWRLARQSVLNPKWSPSQPFLIFSTVCHHEFERYFQTQKCISLISHRPLWGAPLSPHACPYETRPWEKPPSELPPQILLHHSAH